MNGIYWLASYPKSGNTWLRVLLTNYLRNSEEPADINDLELNGLGFDRQTFDEFLGIESADLTRRQIEHYRPLVYERMAAETSEPLFLKVHDAFEYNDEGQPIFSKKATAGAIYLIRNPLDVAVSYAHHQDEPIDEMIRLMNKNNAQMAGSNKPGGQLPQKLGSWSNHVGSWVDEPDLKIHIVRYEDMIDETLEIFSDVLRFVGLNVDLNRVEKAVEFSSFERLRTQETAHGFKEKQPTAKSFFRQGRAGSWREILTEAQISQLITDHQIMMCRFGYLTESGEIPS